VRDDWETLSTRDTNNSDNRPESPLEGGVLAALPRTRPQRASARRDAARQRADKAQSETAVKATPAKVKTTPKAVKPKTAAVKVKPSASKAASAKTKTTPSKATVSKKPAAPPGGRAPIQGYEPEEEIELGKTVNPPSGVELVESVADIFGELANSSLAAGGRILKDAFSLLRRP